MSDLLNRDAILSQSVLKNCSRCGHPRGSHRNDQECQVVGCSCKSFTE